MFTGLIEDVGRVVGLNAHAGKQRLTIESPTLSRQLGLGDSIAVSGVCLTAVDISDSTFGADLAPETLARTSLARLPAGALVNLELPARADSRLGGHIVQGHVDGVATLVSLERIAQSEDYWLEIELPADLVRYVVFKGSIAIEGISLTVAKVEGARVGIAIIPHTRQATNLRELQSGDPLNIEVDVIAKYTERMLRGDAPTTAITLERLLAEGF